MIKKLNGLSLTVIGFHNGFCHGSVVLLTMVNATIIYLNSRVL